MTPKLRVYLAAGSVLVMLADPRTETVRLYDAAGERVLHAGDVLTHPALPGFAPELEPLFARVR